MWFNSAFILTTQIVVFNFGVSSFDLWLFSLLRVILFTLVVLAFCFNKVSVLKRVRQLTTPFTVLLVLIFSFSVAKLLASFEFYQDGSSVYGSNRTTPTPSQATEPCTHSSTTPCASTIGPSQPRTPSHPWLWAIVTWTVVCVLLYGLLYNRITKVAPHVSLLRNRHLFVNVQGGEETPLLNGDPLKVTDDEAEIKRKISTWKVMWTIVTYTKPDIHLYISGFSFLIISSSAMSFIPYYTGQIINHIAISPSTEEFERAILIMVGISIISAVTAGLRGSILIVAIGRLNIAIRKALFKSLLHQEIGFFDKTETGDLTSRLTSDTTKLSDQIGLNLNIFLRYIKSIICGGGGGGG